jgi:aryl sulfotransferase
MSFAVTGGGYGLDEMRPFPKGMVWIASYPKSGNTWLRILLSNLAAGSDVPEDINKLTLDEDLAGSRELFERQTLVDSFLLRPTEIESLRAAALDAYAASRDRATFLKAHDAWTRLPDGSAALGTAARAALYIVRDPRDVAVSLAFHQGMHIDRAIEYMNKTENFSGPTASQVRQRTNGWSGHVRSWLDESGLSVFLIRYEDLHAGTADVFCKVLHFLGVSFENEAVEREEAARAVLHSDFCALQRQEREKGFAERLPGQASFFREGRPGVWRDHLTVAQVRKIETAHADVMARLAYGPVTIRECAA